MCKQRKWSSMVFCGICTEGVEVLHSIGLYVTGSEGLCVCHECEMLLVQHVRNMKSLVAKSKILGVKIGRRYGVTIREE